MPWEEARIRKECERGTDLYQQALEKEGWFFERKPRAIPVKPKAKPRLRTQNVTFVFRDPQPKRDPREAKTIHELIRIVARNHNITFDDIVGRRRYRHVVAARREVCEIAYRHLKQSTVRIGRILNRDHSTILNLLGRRGPRGGTDIPPTMAAVCERPVEGLQGQVDPVRVSETVV